MSSPKYRYAHQQLRAALVAQLIPGTPCPQPIRGVPCGKPMYPGQRLELGHNSTGGYLGLVHARCNHQAGAIYGNWLRGRTCRICKNKFWPSRQRQPICDKCSVTAAPMTPTTRPW